MQKNVVLKNVMVIYVDTSKQKEKEYEDRIQALEQQLNESTKQEIKLPKSDEDIEAWAKQYPDVAAIVETLQLKKQKNNLQIRRSCKSSR